MSPRLFHELEQRILLTQVAYDGFNYTSGSLINGQNGGVGWSGAWVETPSFPDSPNDTINSSGMSYTSGTETLTATGLSLKSLGVGSDDSRTYSYSAGTTLYFSFLLRHDVVGTANGDYGGLVIDGNNNGEGLFVGDPGGNGDVISAGVSGTSAGLVQSSTTLGLGQTVFLVARVTLLAGADSLRLYINPTPNSTEASNTNFIDKNDYDIGSAFNNASNGGLATLELITGQNATWSIDELRVGTTFADVTPDTLTATAVKASDGTFNNEVQVTWTAAPAATAYDVYRSTGINSASAIKLNSSDITGTTFDDSTATPGTVYWYWVKAKNGTTSGPFSSNDPGYATPATVGSFTFVTVGNTDPYFVTANSSNILITFGTSPLPTPTYIIPLAQATSLHFSLQGTANKTFINFAATSPVPSGGITVTGVSGSQDELRIIGSGSSQIFSMSDTQIGLASSTVGVQYQNIATMTLLNLTANFNGMLSNIQTLNVNAGANFVWQSTTSPAVAMSQPSADTTTPPDPTTTTTTSVPAPVSAPLTSSASTTSSDSSDDTDSASHGKSRKFNAGPLVGLPSIYTAKQIAPAFIRGTSWHGDPTDATAHHVDPDGADNALDS